MVVGAGWDQAPIIKEARNRGHVVIALDRDPESYGLQFADKAIDLEVIDDFPKPRDVLLVHGDYIVDVAKEEDLRKYNSLYGKGKKKKR